MKNSVLVCAAVAVLANSTAIQAVEFDYVLTGGVTVIANENAVNFMIVDVTSALHIDGAGVISGEGSLSYIYMNPCAWEAPIPVDENNCRIDGVQDGSFSISGTVLETIHRHDDGNPLKDAIFEYADARASTRPDYAPYRLSLTLTPLSLPEENLAFWGFSTSNIEQRSTGAATLGVLSSGLFNQSFEIIALNGESEVPVPDDAHVISSTGVYNAGTLVQGTGRMILTSLSRDWLPDGTDPYVYLSSWINGPDDRELLPFELDAIAEFEESGMKDTREDKFYQIEEAMQDLVDIGAIDEIVDYNFIELMHEARGLPSPLPPQG